MSAPLYFEQKVADRLGLASADVKYLRNQVLKKNNDWMIHGRDIVLTQRGLDQILETLADSGNGSTTDFDFTGDLVPSSNGEKNGALPVNDATELTVHRTYRNPKLLEAMTDGGELVVVQVKVNKNFRPKMKLRATLVHPGRYEMDGRCPRFPGRY